MDLILWSFGSKNICDRLEYDEKYHRQNSFHYLNIIRVKYFLATQEILAD